MTNNAHTARARGAAIEQVAAQWLRQQGLTLLAQNHYVKGGELDLVMQDGETVVFIEVKHRVNTRFGHPLETVTYQKQQRLIRAARLYIAQNRLSSPCRFDILGIVGKPPDLEFHWAKAAFDAF